MIIKSSQRGYRQKLADHLTKTTENEKVDFTDSRFVSAGGKNPVHQALSVMELMSAPSSRCKNPFYHISVNPDDNLNQEQWLKVWEIYEKEYGLEDQAFVEVMHTKKGRSHRHRVYNRVTDEGKTLKISFNHPRNEKIARILEYEFHHPLTVGRHNRAVMNHLKAEGLTHIVQWMEEQGAYHRSRPVAQTRPDEDQQQKRTKLDIEQVKADLRWAYQRTENGFEFLKAIATKGYMLARGNRRDYVIVDKTGNIHSPRRRLGVKAKELREKWADLTPEKLFSVEEVKSEQKRSLSCALNQSIRYFKGTKTMQDEFLSYVALAQSISPDDEPRSRSVSFQEDEEEGSGEGLKEDSMPSEVCQDENQMLHWQEWEKEK